MIAFDLPSDLHASGPQDIIVFSDGKKKTSIAGDLSNNVPSPLHADPYAVSVKERVQKRQGPDGKPLYVWDAFSPPKSEITKRVSSLSENFVAKIVSFGKVLNFWQPMTADAAVTDKPLKSTDDINPGIIAYQEGQYNSCIRDILTVPEVNDAFIANGGSDSSLTTSQKADKIKGLVDANPALVDVLAKTPSSYGKYINLQQPMMNDVLLHGYGNYMLGALHMLNHMTGERFQLPLDSNSKDEVLGQARDILTYVEKHPEIGEKTLPGYDHLKVSDLEFSVRLKYLTDDGTKKVSNPEFALKNALYCLEADPVIARQISAYGMTDLLDIVEKAKDDPVVGGRARGYSAGGFMSMAFKILSSPEIQKAVPASETPVRNPVPVNNSVESPAPGGGGF